MKKIIATINKEWLLLRRDIAGMLLLLVMPAALIIVMALIQDAPFREFQDVKFEMLLADNDHGSLARQITDSLKNSHNFHVTDSIDGAPLTEARLKELLNKGDYKVGIVIPAGLTAEIVNSANIVVNDIAGKAAAGAMFPTREIRSDIAVHLYFDPVSKPLFRSAISSALDKFITYSCSSMLLQRLSAISKDTSANTSGDLQKIMQGIGVKEEPLGDGDEGGMHISSVQHNVPAWAIFGMFFIVIPISGHIIKEREDGSGLRLALIPNVLNYVGLGRIIFFTLVCTMQFALMICMGLWAMPLFGLPVLYPGTHAWLLLPVAMCIGFVASTYGYFVGSLLKTVNQSLPFGSVSVVILSAIGGIWVPIEIMPHSMQQIAVVSPMHWSLEAVDRIILRNGNINSLLQPVSILLATGSILWLASMMINKRRSRIL